MTESEKAAEVGRGHSEGLVELDEKKVRELLRWSFYFSQGAGGFLRRDEDGVVTDTDESGLHCLMYEFIASRHPNYRIKRELHSPLLKREIPEQSTFVTEGPHTRMEPGEVREDASIAYRYLRDAFNKKRFARREVLRPSLIRIAQKMLDRDWKFLTNAMTVGTPDFEYTKRPNRTGNEGKGFEAEMSQFIHYILLRPKGETVVIQQTKDSPKMTAPPEFIEMLDAVAEELRLTDARAEFNVTSSEFDGTYGQHLKALIERHNKLNPDNPVSENDYRHLWE